METSEFAESKRRFDTNSYSLSQFKDPRLTLFTYEPIKELLENFDIGKALSIIANPDPTGFYPAQYPKLVGILSRCGFDRQMLGAIKELPMHVAPFLAMRDEEQFQEEAARIFSLPGLPEALNRLRKSRLTLADVLFVARCGEQRPDFLTALSDSITMYQLDQDYTFTHARTHGFSGFVGARNGQLCYFFINRPDLLPRFQGYIDTLILPPIARAPEPVKNLLERLHAAVVDGTTLSPDDSCIAGAEARGKFMYVEAFYYRAAVLHLINARKKAEAHEWMDQMTNRVQYFPAGSPAGFIRDTIKMATKLESISSTATKPAV